MANGVSFVCSNCGETLKLSALCISCENLKSVENEKKLHDVMNIFDNIEFLIGPDGKIVGCHSRTEKFKTLRVAVISCSKRKQKGIHRAEHLYSSPLFRASIAYAMAHFERVYILSAKYGLLSPDDRVESYNVHINSLSKSRRRRWAEMTAAMMLNRIPKGSHVSFFCGKAYRENLIPFVVNRFKVEIPLKGLAIGKQLRWFNSHNKSGYRH